jgi:NADPH:quinone reductase
VKAIVARPGTDAGLVIEEIVSERAPRSDEAAIRVETISLNQGEVRHALELTSDGTRPGWDFAGVVERASDDGDGPGVGLRVVGFVEEGAWCERVVAPVKNLAVLPASMSFAMAATLPVAGLTALYALAEGGLLVGRRLLVNGASGGVGHFALQLGRAAGAHVTAAVRRSDHVALAEADGANEVLITEDLYGAATAGRYDLILESVGGNALANALGMLSAGGVCVSYGNSSRASTSFNVFDLFLPHGRASLVGFYLLPTLRGEPASVGLSRLLSAVAEEILTPRIEIEAPWLEIGGIAKRFINRQITGKVVLHVQ